jgi:hypothetical protein
MHTYFVKTVSNTLLNLLLYYISFMVFLMYQSTLEFYDKHISTTVLAFVYCVEILLHVSTLSGHLQVIIS